MPRVEVERDSYYTEFHRTPEGDGPSTAYATATGRSALLLALGRACWRLYTVGNTIADPEDPERTPEPHAITPDTMREIRRRVVEIDFDGQPVGDAAKLALLMREYDATRARLAEVEREREHAQFSSEVWERHAAESGRRFFVANSQRDRALALVDLVIDRWDKQWLDPQVEAAAIREARARAAAIREGK